MPKAHRKNTPKAGRAAAKRNKRTASRHRNTARSGFTMTMAGPKKNVAVVDLEGDIGFANTSLRFAKALDRAVASGAKQLVLRINSPGGDVLEALGMYDKIMGLRIPTRAEINGCAASAGSLIAMAADEIAITPNSSMMIHQPSAMCWGTVDEMKNYVDMLVENKSRIFGIYGARCGKTGEQVMKDHTQDGWYYGQEAVDYGIADYVMESDPEDEEPEAEEEEDPEETDPESEGDENTDPEAEGEEELDPEAEGEEEDPECEGEEDPEAEGDEEEEPAARRSKARGKKSLLARMLSAFGIQMKDLTAEERRRIAPKTGRAAASRRGKQRQTSKAALDRKAKIEAARMLADMGVDPDSLPIAQDDETSACLNSANRVPAPKTRQEYMSLSAREKQAFALLNPDAHRRFTGKHSK